MWNFSEDIKQMIETGEKLRKQIEERERFQKEMVLLLPCGARDYKSAKAAKADFDSNLLFMVAESTAKFDSFHFVSKADLAEVEFIIILFDDGKRFTTIRQC